MKAKKPFSSVKAIRRSASGKNASRIVKSIPRNTELNLVTHYNLDIIIIVEVIVKLKRELLKVY